MLYQTLENVLHVKYAWKYFTSKQIKLKSLSLSLCVCVGQLDQTWTENIDFQRKVNKNPKNELKFGHYIIGNHAKSTLVIKIHIRLNLETSNWTKFSLVLTLLFFCILSRSRRNLIKIFDMHAAMNIHAPNLKNSRTKYWCCVFSHELIIMKWDLVILLIINMIDYY